MDTSILEDLGLTNAEIKVYLASLEIGTSTAGPILEKTKLQNSVVHMTLHKLVEKGFMSFVKKGKVRHYHSTDPKNIIGFIEEKKKRFETILPELLIRQKKQEKQEAEIYEGFKGFKAMLYELMKGAKRGDECLFFSFYAANPDDFENAYTFYKDFEKDFNKKGVITKGITPSNIKDKFKGRDVKNILFVDFPTPTNISIFKNRIAFTPWEDKQMSFLINSRQLAESFRQYFYSIWDKYKK